MHYSFDVSGQSTAVSGRQEGQTVGAARLALFDPDGRYGGDTQAEAGREGQTVEDLIDAYLDATEASAGTRLEYHTTKRKWAAWVRSSVRSYRPMVAGDVTAEDLEKWLNWIYQQAMEEGVDNPGRCHNKRRCDLRAVFAWACRPNVRRLSSMPAFPEKKKQRSEAGHYFLTDQEIERLYWATYQMPTPRGWADPRPIGALWRCALVLWRNYGVDTQLLMPFTRRATEQITWGTVWVKDALPPGRVANCPNGDGWIVCKRQKTGRALFLPLESVSRAHIEAIRPAVCDPDEPILGGAGGGKPCSRFQELCELARLTEKWDVELQRPVKWEIKDLRKTCATVHDANIPDSGRYVLGHSNGTITERHYSNALPVLVKAISTLPQPAAFRSILDATIKPPIGTLLFAK